MQAFDLADYRAAVADHYLSATGLADFRARRDELFRTHPQSPIPLPERAAFAGLRYFPPNEDAIAEVVLRDEPGGLEVDTGGPDGVVRYTRVGILDTPWGALSLWWIVAYGGGLFLPIHDGTSGIETYGGGRYLTDTVKGTHGRGLQPLGNGRVRLDLNYAFNPSCAYDDQWACPLAPPENRVGPAIRAGELRYH
jgi:uncharacterized protein (DUF1684 family)